MFSRKKQMRDHDKYMYHAHSLGFLKEKSIKSGSKYCLYHICLTQLLEISNVLKPIES